MGAVSDERWEFDLDVPRSEADDSLRRPKMGRSRRSAERYLNRLVRIRFGSTRSRR